MAQRVQVVRTDDLDGRQAVETISFALDGTSYEIDLSAKNSTKLRKTLAPYIAAARGTKETSQVTRPQRVGRAVPRTFPVSSKAVRVWAKSHRIEVNSRGRVPADVVDRFRQAGN